MDSADVVVSNELLNCTVFQVTVSKDLLTVEVKCI